MNKILAFFLLIGLLFQNFSTSQTLDATLLEINFSAESEPENFNKVGDNVYFIADDGTHGRELWITDGSLSGTRMVKNIREFSSSAFSLNNIDKYTSIGNIFYFIAQDDQSGKQLWRTDGTEAGTSKVKNESESMSTYKIDMVTLGNKIIYNFKTYSFGEELWVSDGTEAGTHLLKDIRPGSNDANPNSMFLFNNHVYFVANDGVNGSQLWKTDGTEAGTQIAFNVSGISVSQQDFLELNGKFYFSAYESTMGGELWSSDGTTAGTQLVKEIYPGYQSGVSFLEGQVIGSQLLFKGNDAAHGNEIWRTDGTSAGTFIVKDINGNVGGSLGYNSPFVSFDGNMYFIADDEINGSEVWKTNGTEAGTVMLKDITPGQNYSQPGKLFATSNYLYFLVFDEIEEDTNIWVSNGTESGTQLLLNEDVGRFSLVELNNQTLFTAKTPLHGNELWETNGNPNNTLLFKDINASNSADLSSPQFFNDKLIFYARNSVVGREPFISDGTVAGTRGIADINPGDGDSNNIEYNPLKFAQAGNNVVFFARSDVGGIELYKCDLDGTNASLLKNINGTTTSSINPSSFLISFNNEAYFSADDGIHGGELWKTDGTENGTVMVKDITPNSGTSLLKPFIFKNWLYMRNLSGNTVRLYRTDGTEAGTQSVIGNPNINVLATSDDYIYFAASHEFPVVHQTNKVWKMDENNVTELLEEWPLYEDITLGAVYNNELYFAASDYSSGYHAIYKTNGTPNTAERIFYGTNYNIFLNMKVCGDYLYVTRGRSDGLNVFKEVWRTDGTLPGSQIIISETTHPTFGTASTFDCLNNSKFIFNDFDSPGIYSIDGNENDARFHPLNIVNDNFEIRLVNDVYVNGSQLMLNAWAAGHGAELYSVDSSEILSISDFASVIDGKQQSVFRAYPNPIKNSVTISNILKLPIEKLELFNLTGQKIGETKTDNSQSKASLSLENLSSGIYLIKVYSNEKTETLKVIKE